MQNIAWKNVDFTGTGGYMVMDSILTLIILGIIAYELHQHPQHKKKYVIGLYVLTALMAAGSVFMVREVMRDHKGLLRAGILVFPDDKQNVFVLITDYNNPNDIMARLTDADLAEAMTGYTLYADTSGISDDRTYNLFEMLTGVRPDPNNALTEQSKDAYKSSPVMNALKENKFLVKEKDGKEPLRVSYAPVSMAEDYVPALL